MSVKDQLEKAGFKESPPPGPVLRQLAAQAAFTVVDMATWCGSYKQAMREWMTNDVKPHSVRMRYLQQHIELLKAYLAKPGGMLPVPMGVSQYERKAYIERAKNDALKTVSKGDSTGRRRKVLD